MHFDFEEDEEFDEAHPDDFLGYREFYRKIYKTTHKILYILDNHQDDLH